MIQRHLQVIHDKLYLRLENLGDFLCTLRIVELCDTPTLHFPHLQLIAQLFQHLHFQTHAREQPSAVDVYSVPTHALASTARRGALASPAGFVEHRYLVEPAVGQMLTALPTGRQIRNAHLR